MDAEHLLDLSRDMLTIAWNFGPKGLDGSCCNDLTMPEFFALDSIARTKDCAVQEVGRALGFTKSGATRVVNRLERKGYVSKQRSGRDGRVCCVVIADKGTCALDDAYARYVGMLEGLLSRLDGGDAKYMVKAFGAAAGILREVPHDGGRGNE